MNTFSVSYSITDNDYITFNDHFLKHTKAGKTSLLSIRLIAPIMSLFVWVIFLIIGSDLFVTIAQLVLFTVFSVIWWICSRSMMLRHIKNRLKKANSIEKSLFSKTGQLVFDFDNRVIIDKTEDIELKVFFDKILCYYKTNDAFYFYFGPAQAIILPFHQFQSTDEFTQFENNIHSTFSQN